HSAAVLATTCTILCFHCAGAPGNLHSFPTRRSSDLLPEAVEDLARLWSQLTAHQVFRVGPPALAQNALRWATRLMSGGAPMAPRVHGLLDTAPLRALLERSLVTADGEIVGITEKLERGLLKAIALTTINYSTGQTVTWVQGSQIRDWERPLRRSA